MRVPGRFWWRWMIAAGAVAIGGGLFVVTELARQMWQDWSAGRPLGSDWVFPALAAVEVATWAAYLVWKAVSERGRYVRRRAALRGERGSVPRADIVISRTGLPDVASESLAIVRAALPAGNTSPRRRVLSLAAQSGVAILATSAVAVWLVNTTEQSERAIGLLTSTAMLWPGMLPMIVLAGVAPIVLGVIAARSARAQEYSLVVTGDGIEQRGPGRQNATIPWGELRLVEISADDQPAFPARRYRLYGDRCSIEWTGERVGLTGLFGAGQAAADAQHQLDLLMGIIRARTGLVPRTFERRWRVRSPSSASRRQSRGIGALVTLLVIALASVGLAVAVLLAPPTTETTLNTPIAASLGMFTVFCLFVAVSEARQRRAPAQGPLSATVAEQPHEPGMVYAFSLEPTRLARVLFGLLGAALLIDLAPAALWLLTALAAPLGVPHLVTVSVGPTILAFVLFLYGLFGLGAVWLALHGTGRTVRADDWGLSIALGRWAIVRTLQWESIEDISPQILLGNVTGYVIRDASGKVPIIMPARNSWQQRVQPVPGTHPVTPAEMAALMARRSGSGRAAQGEGTSE